MFEDFTLSTNIAGDCEEIFDLQAQGVCGIPDAYGLGMNIFNTSAGGNCFIQGGDTDTYNGFCYHIPTESQNLFNS